MNISLALDFDYLRSRFPAAGLLAPEGGLLGGVVRVIGDDSSPDFEIAHTSLGNLTAVFPHVRGANGEDASQESLGGSGADADPEWAWLRAVMEGAERYASMAWHPTEFITASGNELGDAALDLDTLPRCSEREYANPRCPYVPADKTRPIRWVRGWSLVDARERMVPAVMTHLYFRPTRTECFWQMISTGVAAHVSLEAALVSAICEVVERDAIALTWLARLPLPRIELPDALPAPLVESVGRVRRSAIEHYAFDATTDVGVPTVYAVQTLDGHPTLANYVNCATEFDAAIAYAKTIREAAAGRTAFKEGATYPAELDDFMALHDGATYLGAAERRSAFEFLLRTPNRRHLDAIGAVAGVAPSGRLAWLVDRLRSLGMDIIAVDLTTDDLRERGIWVVRVVIPGLMPMTSTHAGRFLAHPRLYAYPRDAGFGVLREEDINPEPQPFA